MNLKESLEKKRFVVTSEIQAPLGDEEPESLIQSLSKIRGRVDGVSVQETELEGVVGDNIRTCELLRENRFNAIYQTTTRDK
ncbi:MAG TPA: methylenetetrahydrofolate reductase, partial [Desulfobacteraceae bacterium]|nr:methylenetetrahydrofolate reductase [Desulfobacteraceae bacterium]